MAYTTIAKIRQEAGLQNNSNVSDTVITQYQTRAFNMVKGYVAARYDLDTLSGALFTGSQAESVLEQCELLLAAGYLLLDEYQGQPMGETNGKNKVDDAVATLDKISKGHLRLLDVNGDAFTRAGKASAGLSASYTAPPRTDTEPTSSDRKFTGDTGAIGKKW